MNFITKAKLENCSHAKRLKTAVTSIALSALFYSCAPDNSIQSRTIATETPEASGIVGGVSADQKFLNETGVVGLMIFTQDELGREGQATCTGSLIDKRIVLTAAHCIVTENLKAIAVVFTTDFDKTEESQVRFAINARVHEKYMSEVKPDDPKGAVANWHDMGILYLSEDAPSDVKIVKLADAKTVIKAGQGLMLTGFGITNAIVRQFVKDKKGKPVILNGQPVTKEFEGIGSGVLRKVENIEVVQMMNDNNEILLDQKKLKGACHGDSGGPAFLKQADGSLLQVGLTSRGLDALGNCNNGAIYTGISAKLDWIKTKSAELIQADLEAQAAAKAAAEKDVKPLPPKVAG